MLAACGIRTPRVGHGYGPPCDRALNGGESGATAASFTSPSESSVSAGTGAYRDPQASGTLTLLANTRSGHIVLDWGGSGDFR